MFKRTMMKVYVLSDNIRFPIYLIPLYAAGVVLMHLHWLQYSGKSVELLFIACELGILKALYVKENDISSGIKAHIVIMPLVYALFLMLDPMYCVLWHDPVIKPSDAVLKCRAITILIDYFYIVCSTINGRD